MMSKSCMYNFVPRVYRQEGERERVSAGGDIGG